MTPVAGAVAERSGKLLTPQRNETRRPFEPRILAILLLLITGCIPSEHIAEYGMEPAGQPLLDEEPAPGELRSFVFEGARDVRAIRYESGDVVVDWITRSSGVSLEVENRTDQPIRVDWSAARLEGSFEAPLVLTDPGGREERAMPQAPTAVAPGERAHYGAIPGPPGAWQSFTGEEHRGFWQRERSVFDLDVDKASNDEARDQLARQAVGRTLRLVLPLELEGRVHELVLPARVGEATTRPSYY